jgi:hypothetical protein
MPPTPADALPTVDDVLRIAALADPVLRNLQITACYHQLALAMTARTGVSANWCTFATWASKQAGQTIRKEDLSRTLEDIIRSALTAQAEQDVSASAQALGSPHSADEIQESVFEVLNPLAAFDRASDAVARGNKKVFEEIGFQFARFYALCLNDSAFDAEKIAAFNEGLSPGDPGYGQDYLKRAFSRYYQAFFEPNAKVRAELILLANIEIGLHEQTRLQPEITEAMEAAFVDRQQFRWRLLRALFPYRGWLAWLRLLVFRLFNRPSPFDAVLDNLLGEARRRSRLLITEYVMTITLPPDLRVHLGADLLATFPASLQQIALSDLCALLETLDRTPDSTSDTGAVDWSDLRQRLHFIADLFRCYQETATLFDAPFSAEQVADLREGRLPQGRL